MKKNQIELKILLSFSRLVQFSFTSFLNKGTWDEIADFEKPFVYWCAMLWNVEVNILGLEWFNNFLRKEKYKLSNNLNSNSFLASNITLRFSEVLYCTKLVCYSWFTFSSTWTPRNLAKDNCLISTLSMDGNGSFKLKLVLSIFMGDLFVYSQLEILKSSLFIISIILLMQLLE